jgi:hypothetical protein
MSRNRKSRARNSQNNNNGNGHRPSNTTVNAVKNGTATKTRNSLHNFNQIVDADELDEDVEEEYDEEEKTSRTRKIWLAAMAVIVLCALIGTAVNNLKQYQVKAIPSAATTTPSESPTIEANLATQLAKNKPAEVESINSEKDSYFDLAEQGYNRVISDYISSNGFRHYTTALQQQSKGRSAHRLLLQKLSTAIKQHELLIGKNEAMAVSNPDSMKLLGTSLDVLSMLNALQRLCQSNDTCDGTQNFNDFTVPSADALVNLRLYQNEEITSLTQSQEFQVRKQIIEEKAKLPKVKPDEKAKPATNKADNNNSGLQRSN